MIPAVATQSCHPGTLTVLKCAASKHRPQQLITQILSLRFQELNGFGGETFNSDSWDGK